MKHQESYLYDEIDKFTYLVTMGFQESLLFVDKSYYRFVLSLIRDNIRILKK